MDISKREVSIVESFIGRNAKMDVINELHAELLSRQNHGIVTSCSSLIVKDKRGDISKLGISRNS